MKESRKGGEGMGKEAVGITLIFHSYFSTSEIIILIPSWFFLSLNRAHSVSLYDRSGYLWTGKM